MTTLFISDLHLSPNTPNINACFITFMREEAIHADALYVLGDLFEFWIGDDDKSDFAQQIRAEFKQLTDAGVRRSLPKEIEIFWLASVLRNKLA